MKVGVIENQDGSVRIAVPAEGFTPQDVADNLGLQCFEIEFDTLPATRVFRNAWTLNQAGDGIAIDIAKAKVMVIEANKRIVDKQLAAIQPAFNEAYDNDDTVLLNQIKVDRKDIRDELSDKIADINAATTAAEVEGYLP